MRNKNSIQKNKVSKRVDYELLKWDAQLEYIRQTVTFEPAPIKQPKEADARKEINREEEND